MPTRSFIFSSSRSIGSRSTLRVAVFAIVTDSSIHRLDQSPLIHRCTAACCSRRAPPESPRRSAGLPRRSACDRPPGTSAGSTGSPRPPERPCPDTDRRSSTATSGAGTSRAGRLNGATNDLRRQGVGDDDRQIADDERMARQRRASRRRRPPARAPAHRGSARRRRRDPGAAGRARRRRPAAPDRRCRSPCPVRRRRPRRSTPSGQRRGTARGAVRTAHRHAERVAQLLGDALDVEEVDLARAARPVLAAAAAGPRERRRRASRRRARSACRSRTAARRAGRAGGCARRRRRGRAGATAAACRTSPTAGWRHGDQARAAAGCVVPCARRNELRRPGLDEAERDRFREAGGRQHRGARAGRAGYADPAAAPAASRRGTSRSSLSKP